MARIRTIKPEFWTDDAVTECSIAARLLFIGTWNFADDAGNLDRSARQLKKRVFPSDEAIDCEPLLVELITHGVLREYSVSGKKYLHIKGFAEHQVINRPSKSSCPPYVNGHTLTEYSRSTHDGREGKGRERKGKEGKGREESSRSSNESPAGLDSLAWERWEQYRLEIKKPLRAASILAAQRQMVTFGDTQSAVVEQSIANGWQGLFELKSAVARGSKTKHARALENLNRA